MFSDERSCKTHVFNLSNQSTKIDLIDEDENEIANLRKEIEELKNKIKCLEAMVTQTFEALKPNAKLSVSISFVVHFSNFLTRI